MHQTLADAQDALEAQFRAVASVPSTRADANGIQNHLTGLGTANDKGATARPSWRQPLTPVECDWLYEHGGLAARIVDKPAGDAVRHGWRVRIADESADSDPTAPWDEDLDVWSAFREALTNGSKHGGSLIVMLTDEDLPAYENDRDALAVLAEPLDLDKLRSIRRLLVVDRTEAAPIDWEDDTREDGFGEVRTWSITVEGMEGVTVHASRVIYVPGRPLSRTQRRRNGGWDQSDLDWCWSQLRNVATLEATAASVAQEIKVDVMQVSRLSELSPKDQLDILEARYSFMARTKSALGFVLIGEGEQFTRATGGLTGYAELADVAWTALAAVIGMQRVVLYGDTPGGLNSDGQSHRQLHQDFIDDRQDARLLRPLRKLYRALFAAKEGPTKGQVPESWAIEFHPIYSETRAERAAVEKTHAETDQIRINSGVVLPAHVAESRFSEEGYQDDLKPVDLADLEEATYDELGKMGEGMEDEPTPAAEPAPVVDPAATTLPGGEVAAVQDTALNGAQVAALVDVLKEVTARQMAPEVAELVLLSSFPGIRPERAKQMVQGAAAFVPAPTEQTPAEQPEQPQPSVLAPEPAAPQADATTP